MFNQTFKRRFNKFDYCLCRTFQCKYLYQDGKGWYCKNKYTPDEKIKILLSDDFIVRKPYWCHFLKRSRTLKRARQRVYRLK